MATKNGPLQSPPLTPGRMLGAHDSGTPRPLYFVCREDGSFVPLIAADELPHGLQLRGVPRRFLNLSSTVGMLNLGVIPSTNRCYSLETFSPRCEGDTVGPTDNLSDQYRTPDTVIAQRRRPGCEMVFTSSQHNSGHSAQSTQVIRPGPEIETF